MKTTTTPSAIQTETRIMAMNEAPREKLCELIARDTSLCDEPLRMEGLLRDLCPHNRREINVLILALRERIAADLQSSSSAVPIEIVISRLAKRLEDQHAVTREMARWAVESWALALGTISLAQLSVPKEEESARTSRRATSSAQKTPAQSLATLYPTSATSVLPTFRLRFAHPQSNHTQVRSPRTRVRHKVCGGCGCGLSFCGVPVCCSSFLVER